MKEISVDLCPECGSSFETKYYKEDNGLTTDGLPTNWRSIYVTAYCCKSYEHHIGPKYFIVLENNQVFGYNGTWKPSTLAHKVINRIGSPIGNLVVQTSRKKL